MMKELNVEGGESGKKRITKDALGGVKTFTPGN